MMKFYVKRDLSGNVEVANYAMYCKVPGFKKEGWTVLEAEDWDKARKKAEEILPGGIVPAPTGTAEAVCAAFEGTVKPETKPDFIYREEKPVAMGPFADIPEEARRNANWEGMKPCPFCGCKSLSAKLNQEENHPFKNNWTISCDHCHSSSPSNETWNARARDNLGFDATDGENSFTQLLVKRVERLERAVGSMEIEIRKENHDA